MKKTSILLFIASMFIMAMLVIGCQEPADSSGGGGGGGNNNNSTTTTPTTTTPTTTTPTYTITYDGNGNTGGSVPVDSTSYTEGQNVSVSGNSGNLTKINCNFLCWNTESDGTGTFYIPGKTFTMGNANVVLYAVLMDKSEMASIAGGTYTQTDGTNSFDHAISSFSMGKYEVTYELWYTVYQWAITQGYTFANAGREGNDGTNGAAPTGAMYEPVTMISWRDSIVWCNAYSGMSGLSPVYYTDAGFTTPLKISTNNTSTNTTPGSEDNPYVNWLANGYRLPTEGEWQYAASNKGVTPYNYVSGDSTPYNTSTTIGNYVWYSTNSGSKTHDAGTKTANALNLYDMSGNVYEWCWDWQGDYPTTAQIDYRGPAVSVSNRIIRSGSWNRDAAFLQVSFRLSGIPYNEGVITGFRVLRR